MTARHSGFTLIELILATGMVAMLTLSLYVGLATAFRARTSVLAQTDVMRQGKVALDLIEQDLRSILPPSGTLAGPFIGTPSGTGGASIDCYGLGSDYQNLNTPTGDGMRHVLLSMLQDGTSYTLVRAVTRDLLNGATATPEEEILARDIVQFSARYFDGAAWTDTWDSTQQNNALPLAVEVTIELKKPTPGDLKHTYKLARMINLPCGLTPDQAAAVVAAAAALSGTSTDPANPTDPAQPTTPMGGAQ